MDSATWDSLRKSGKAKSILESAKLSPALIQLKWSSLTGADRKKLEAVAQGRGWHEEPKEIITKKGVEKKAPEHHRAAVKTSLETTLRAPMVTKCPECQHNMVPCNKEYSQITKGAVKEGELICRIHGSLEQIQQYKEEKPPAPKEKKAEPVPEPAPPVVARAPEPVIIAKPAADLMDELEFYKRIDDATTKEDVGSILREVDKSSLSKEIINSLNAYGKKKFNQLIKDLWRSKSDLTLVNEFKSKIESAGDVDTLKDLNIEIIDAVAKGKFSEAGVMPEDVHNLHALADMKMFHLYYDQIGDEEQFAKKVPMNLIVISTEQNRLRDLDKKIQQSYLKQGEKDKLQVTINHKINKILKLPTAAPQSSSTDIEKRKARLAPKTFIHEAFLLKLKEINTLPLLEEFDTAFREQSKLSGFETIDDPLIKDIAKAIYDKRKLLENLRPTQTKILRSVDDYEVKNLQYEAENLPKELQEPEVCENPEEFIWGLKEADAIKKVSENKKKQLQSNITYVNNLKALLDEMAASKPHVLLTKIQINKKYPNAAEAEDKLRDMWTYKQKKAEYEKNAESVQFWQDKVDKINSGDWQRLNEIALKTQYIKVVKNAIKHGEPVPYDVIKQYSEFTKAQTSRERYDKGRHTSFANVSIAVDTRYKENHGIKIKLQDGTPMEDKYADDIMKLITIYQSIVGDITPIMKREDITIAHTKGKHPFLSKAAGCYSPTEKTVTLGRKGVGSHELSHFIDRTAHKQIKEKHSDQPLYDFNLLALAKKNMNGGVEKAIDLTNKKTPEELAEAHELRFRLGSYWKRPEELFARLVEQYAAYKTKGSTDTTYLHYPYEELTGTPSYWDDESFMMLLPQVEAELQRKITLGKE